MEWSFELDKDGNVFVHKSEAAQKIANLEAKRDRAKAAAREMYAWLHDPDPLGPSHILAKYPEFAPEVEKKERFEVRLNVRGGEFSPYPWEVIDFNNQGLIAAFVHRDDADEYAAALNEMAGAALLYADALIAALNKELDHA